MELKSFFNLFQFNGCGSSKIDTDTSELYLLYLFDKNFYDSSICELFLKAMLVAIT